MKILQIGDWTLEDRLAMGGRPLVVLFVKSDGQKNHLLRAEFRRVAEEHQAIIDALVSADAELASRKMREHVQASARAWSRTR